MNQTLLSSKKFFSALTVLATVIMPYASFVPVARAADVLPIESFGTGGSVNDVPGWNEEGSDDDGSTLAQAAGSGNDSASLNGGRFAKIHDGEWICRTFNATGYEDLELSYFWRGDADAESDDRGRVEYRTGSGGSGNDGCDAGGGGWTTLQNHDLSVDSTWSTQASFALPDELDDTTFRLRFRTDAQVSFNPPGPNNEDQSDVEYFRVDGVLLTGDVAGQPDLVAEKTNSTEADAVSPDGTFTWSIRVENIGDGDAVFGDNDIILLDQMPAGDDFADYVLGGVVEGPGISGGGDIRCALSDGLLGWDDNEDLRCWADDGSVRFAPDSFFDVFVNVDLNESAEGTITNPRAYERRPFGHHDHDIDPGVCAVDPDNEVEETIGGNNGCGDSLVVGEIPTTGTIIVRKVLVGDDEDVAVDDFYFSVNEGPLIQFEADGENVYTEQSPGSYSIVEQEQGYTPSYDNCSFTLVAGETEICTITNTEVPPAHIIVKKRVQDAPQEGDLFEFQLREFYGEGSSFLASNSIDHTLTDSFFDVFFDSALDQTNVIVQETAMTSPWQFVDVFCWEGDGPRPEPVPEISPESTPDDYQTLSVVVDDEIEFFYEGTRANFAVGPTDVVTCEFTNRRPGGGSSQQYGDLVLEKYIRSNATVSFDDFSYEIDGAQFGSNGLFDEDGRNEFDNVPVGTYWVSEPETDGYTATFEGSCDENGEVAVTANETAICRVTNTQDGWEEGDPEYTPSPTPTPEDDDDDEDNGEPSGSGGSSGTLIVQKVIWNNETGTAVFSDFGFTVASTSHQFEEDGTNELQLTPGVYTVVEGEYEGYTTEYSEACNEFGEVTVVQGETVTCVVTNKFGGVGGYNPDAELPTPTPTPTPGGGPTGGSDGPDNSALGGPDTDVTPTPSAPASPSEEPNLQAAAAGPFLGLEVCSKTGEYVWWVTLILLAAALLLFGRRKGTYLWLIVIYVIVWTMWAWQICQFGYWWLPVLLSVIIWLLSVPRPGSQEQR